MHNAPDLKDLNISKEYAHSGKNRWRKKISTVCLTGRKVCLLRIYWRPRFGGGHACENITTVILPRSRLTAVLGCEGAGTLNMCRSSAPGAPSLSTGFPPRWLRAESRGHSSLLVPLPPPSGLQCQPQAEEEERRAPSAWAADAGARRCCCCGTGPGEAERREVAGPSLGQAWDRAQRALHPLADGHLYLFVLSSF